MLSNRKASMTFDDIVPDEVPSINGLGASATVLTRNHEEVRRASRRYRSPLKPGLTAKGGIRHFVQHQYHDHAHDLEEVECTILEPTLLVSFPVKLHRMLSEVEAQGLTDIVSWFPHGRAFSIHKRKTFVERIMPKYFSQTKLSSFQRQLNLYGFTRFSKGPDYGGYYHEKFLKGKLFLSKQICRSRIKGTKFKATSSPENEPNFYVMPILTDTMVDPKVSSTHDKSRTVSDKIVHLNASANLEQQRVRITPSKNVSDFRYYENSSFIPDPNSVQTTYFSTGNANASCCRVQNLSAANYIHETETLFSSLPEGSDYYFQRLFQPNPDVCSENRAYSSIMGSMQDVYYLPTNILTYSFVQQPITANLSDWDTTYQRHQELAMGRSSIDLIRR